jgi:hypothetical protein
MIMKYMNHDMIMNAPHDPHGHAHGAWGLGCRVVSFGFAWSPLVVSEVSGICRPQSP